MLKFRRVLVLIAALPLIVAGNATHATASGDGARNTDAAGAMYVGPAEGVPPNERYPEGSTAF
jgi:hypothetical protein